MCVVILVAWMDERICRAIRKRVLLQFTYDDNPRVVAPYCHGTSKTGAEVVRAIQVGGRSPSGYGTSGKLWIVAKMTNVRILKKTFIPDDPNYNPDDSAMREIHCRV
jgi:hypothetical protein